MEEFSRTTMDSYANSAAWHAEKQQGYDLTGSIERFLKEVRGKRILDLGCGIGRDVAEFQKRGYKVTGIDASPLLALAKQRLRADLRNMDFLQPLDFPDASFDGVWAAASLLHVPKDRLPSVLKELHRVLAPEGALFISVKEGDGEGMMPDWKGEGRRFFALYREAELSSLIEKAGFRILTTEYVGNAPYHGNPHSHPSAQQWVVVLARKH